MRNRYSGICYRCGKHVAAGEGHFERIPQPEASVLGSWRVQHAECAIKFRGQPDEISGIRNKLHRQAQIRMWRRKAKGTGKAASRARKHLRDQGLALDES